jgi:hypothetical protein
MSNNSERKIEKTQTPAVAAAIKHDSKPFINETLYQQRAKNDSCLLHACACMQKK